MSVAEKVNIEEIKSRLEEAVKPFQQDLNARQKQFNFIRLLA